MSRVVNLNSPGKLRSQLMRSAAEIIRRLSQKTEIDEETKDMAAFLVYCFNAIDDSVNNAVSTWEKRDYWVKAARFRTQWAWTNKAALELEDIVRTETWERLVPVLVKLLPHFEDIKIARFTRKPSLWKGAYHRLLEDKAS